MNTNPVEEIEDYLERFCYICRAAYNLDRNM